MVGRMQLAGRNNKASLIESLGDILKFANWEQQTDTKTVTFKLLYFSIFRMTNKVLRRANDQRDLNQQLLSATASQADVTGVVQATEAKTPARRSRTNAQITVAVAAAENSRVMGSNCEEAAHGREEQARVSRRKPPV